MRAPPWIENHISVRCNPSNMGRTIRTVLTVLVIVLMVTFWAPSILAEEHNDIRLIENVYTSEGTSTTRDVILNGDKVLQAFFNFTVLDDDLSSQGDTFTFTVTNMDDAALRQSLPGTTDTSGNLKVNLPFTRTSTPNWKVVVVCNDAGDVVAGPITIREDEGNAWSLQVDYIYEIEDTNGNGGNGGDGDDGARPPLRNALEVNLILVALLAMLVVFLALLQLRGGSNLKFIFALGLILLVNAFFTLPLALVVNQQQYDATFSAPPLGPEWLGNLAVILLVLWVVPIVGAKKLLMTSPMTFDVLSRVIGDGMANALKRRGEGMSADLLPEKVLVVLFMVIGIATVVVAGMMMML